MTDDTRQQVGNVAVTLETITGLSKTINDLVAGSQELFANSAANADLGLKLTSLSAATTEMAIKATNQISSIEETM